MISIDTMTALDSSYNNSILTLENGEAPPSKLDCGVYAMDSRLMSDRMLAIVARNLSQSALVVTGTVCDPAKKTRYDREKSQKIQGAGSILNSKR